MAKMANKEDMAQLAFHYERICQIIVYFKSERDRDEDDEEQMSEIPSWFDSKFISSPKHLEENYDEKTKTHFLVSEQCTDGKMVKSQTPISEEESATLKRANEIIGQIYPFDIGKTMVQLNVAIHLKTQLFLKLFGHKHFLDHSFLLYIREIILIFEDDDWDESIQGICCHSKVLVSFSNQDQNIDDEIFENVRLIIYAYEKKYKECRQLSEEAAITIQGTCGFLLKRYSKLQNLTYSEKTYKMFVFYADYFGSTYDYEYATKVCKEALSYIESIRKRMTVKNCTHAKTDCFYRLAFYLRKRQKYDELLSILNNVTNLSYINYSCHNVAHLWIGETLEIREQYPEAIKHYQKSLHCAQIAANYYDTKVDQLEAYIYLIVLGFRCKMSNKKVCYYMKVLLDTIIVLYNLFIEVILKMDSKQRIYVFFDLLPMITTVLLKKCGVCGSCKYCLSFTKNSKPKQIKMEKKQWRLLKNSVFINQFLGSKDAYLKSIPTNIS